VLESHRDEDRLLRLPITYDNAINDPRTNAHGHVKLGKPSGPTRVAPIWPILKVARVYRRYCLAATSRD
jgi:hypothetical protein